jgi:thymidylate synthase (FAD)
VSRAGVWTGNLRALRHVPALRIDASAEEEIVCVFTLVLKTLLEQVPVFFGDFHRTAVGFWKPEHWKI